MAVTDTPAEGVTPPLYDSEQVGCAVEYRFYYNKVMFGLNCQNILCIFAISDSEYRPSVSKISMRGRGF